MLKKVILAFLFMLSVFEFVLSLDIDITQEDFEKSITTMGFPVERLDIDVSSDIDVTKEDIEKAITVNQDGTMHFNVNLLPDSQYKKDLQDTVEKVLDDINDIKSNRSYNDRRTTFIIILTVTLGYLIRYFK